MAYYALSRSKNNRIKIAISKGKVMALIIVLLLIVFFVWWYLVRVRPILIDTAEANIKSSTTLAVNTAVLSVVSSDLSYGQLMIIEKNNDNDVVLLHANTAYINALSRQMATTVQLQLSNLTDIGVNIPMGTLSGVPFLTGVGDDVSIAVSPISSVNCQFVSMFQSAGINQTMHQIYLQVDSAIEIVIPTLKQTINTSTDVLLCETIIVGNIPNAYLQGAILGGNV